jgi:hypothetical protein
MRRAILLAVVLAGGLIAAKAWAQGQAPTTVQLPTFSFFTVNTTVSVPDSGGAYLGGINRARDGSVVRGLGPLANRGIGSDRVASGMSVHATIIDHAEIDARLRAEAAAVSGPIDPTVAKAESLSRHVGRGVAAAGTTDPGGWSVSTAGPAGSGPMESVSAIRLANAAAADARASEAAEYFAKARDAEAANKPAIAKIYYQMVARRGGDLARVAQARLTSLESTKATVVARK